MSNKNNIDLKNDGGRKPVYLLMGINADYPQKIKEFKEGWKDKEVVEVSIVHGSQSVEMTMAEFMEKVGIAPEFSNEGEKE